jgi:hypothetical protein|tara:strand:- start:653 stop:1066 length:414 start_codon:yes stop_codon:yes gene_type:complete
MANSTVYHLGGADGEQFITKRKTGWIPLTDMSRNTTIRRLNARYSSPEVITAKIYANGDESTAIWNENSAIQIVANKNANGTDKLEDPSDSNSNPLPKYKSLMVGRRANSIMVEISTASTSATAIEINKLEVEVDAK